jgi:pimeloyl-ACP methyl ester carboxylesterase
VAATRDTTTDGTGGYVPINGLDLYDEVRGTRDPLVVVPDGPMTIAMMEPLVAALARSRRVVVVEPQAHGRTADVDRPLTYEEMADVTAALVAHLGFSAGAGIALQTAVRHAEAVRRLVFVAGTFRSDGEYPEVRAFEQAFAPDLPALSQLRDAYRAVSPDPAGWEALVAKMRDLLAREYDWSAQ